MNRYYSAILFTAALFLLFSCTEKKVETSAVSKERSVIDGQGEKVLIPEKIDSIVTFPAPHPHIIVYLDGDGKRIKGLHPLAKSAAGVSILAKIAPELLTLQDNFLTGSSLNAEELLKINPDVFFTDQVLQGMDAVSEAELPVIYLGLEKDGNIFSPEKSIEEWIRITAEVLGTEKKKADQIVEEWKNTAEEINEKVETIPASERKKVLIMFRPRALMAAGGNSFGQYWINATGAVNAAEEITGAHPAMSKLADFEQILKWNPDIIYITNFEETMPEDIYENRIPGQEWSNVKAVAARQVYKIPLGIYRWYPPGLDGPLMLKWMAMKNYPGLFNWDIEKEISSYYLKYFNYSLESREIEKIMNPEGSGTF